MARPVRVEFADAVYHVTARGNERRSTFRDDKDRERFVKTLAEMVERFEVRVHAYCLMPNHYHLVVGTPLGNLSQAVGWLQVTYTVRCNRRWRRSGHLFQGRFKAQLVEADEYAQWLVEYVHLNPVRPRRKGEAIARQRVEGLVAAEADERIKLWLLVRLAGERSAVVGRRLGYRDGAGVAYVLRRLETEARENPPLAAKLRQAKEVIYSLQS